MYIQLGFPSFTPFKFKPYTQHPSSQPLPTCGLLLRLWLWSFGGGRSGLLLVCQRPGLQQPQVPLQMAPGIGRSALEKGKGWKVGGDGLGKCRRRAGGELSARP